MVSPKTEEVLAWLKREEQDAKNRGQIFNLQAALARASTPMTLSYWKHIAAMKAYEQTTLGKYGVTVHFHPENLYRPLGFGIAGMPGYWGWETVTRIFGLRGPRPTGEFD